MVRIDDDQDQIMPKEMDLNEYAFQIIKTFLITTIHDTYLLDSLEIREDT